MNPPKLILLVDDSEDDQFLIQHALRKAGLDVGFRALQTGRQAVDYLTGIAPYADRTVNPLPSLIIIDSKMPDIDGFDFLAWKKDSLFQKIPVVMLTGSLRQEDQERALAAGAARYMIKPIDERAVQAISALLAEQEHG